MPIQLKPLLRSRRAWVVFLVVGLAAASLWYFTAYPRGMLMARIDHARGDYELMVWGPPMPPYYAEYARLLKDRYGVQLNGVGGCLISHELKWYAEGYDSVSYRLLNDKYGKDIFEECWVEGQQQWEAEHPEEAQRLRAEEMNW